MITLAPELCPPDKLAQLSRMGVVVSLGHSDATAQQTRAALALGAGCFTHLFNAMPPMLSRSPGILGAALNAECPAGIIADGHHVAWDMLRIAVRARPGPTFAVSDAMPTVGGRAQTFALYGKSVRLERGRLVNADGALAGAHLDMVTALGNLVRHAGLTLAQACAMCTDYPRRVLGHAAQIIAPGTRAVLLLDEQFNRIRL